MKPAIPHPVPALLLLALLPGAVTPLFSAAPEAVESSEVPGRFTLAVGTEEEGALELDPSSPNIVAASARGRFLRVEFNQDASTRKLLVGKGEGGGMVILDTAEKSLQLNDGTIVFSALDANVEGKTARLESHPGNHRIGFWSDVKDKVSWAYEASRWGKYSVEMTYSLASGESEVEVVAAGDTLTATLAPTGSWYRYTTISIGVVSLEKAGPMSVQVVPVKKSGAAVMNLKAVILRPAPEGDPVVQRGVEAIELDSSAATVHGVTLRYEPAEVKRCLGFWANPKDWASWDFTVATPGKYMLEVTQGCGRGHGGSEVKVLVDGQELTFTVEETGGFQNWLAKEVGIVELARTGPVRLEVRPQNRKGGAVMDIRRIRLAPIGEP